MTEAKTVYGWHFVGDKLRDGSPIPRDNVWLPKITPVKLCERGYHGSLHPFDALQYAPGDTLCYCEFRGQIIHEADKFVAEQRRIVTRMDATEMLHYFARMQALSVADLWEPPDVVLDWLMTGDDSLQVAARDAARDAAGDAAWSAGAAGAAARAAGAAGAAARAAGAARAARYAARDAGDAAGDAAWSAAWSAARDDFAALVYECFGIGG